MTQSNALALAAPVSAAAAPPVAHQYLVFTLNAEAFAVDILHIREIIEYGQLTEVPMMPSTVRGVINLRGAVVPVIDLSARFGRAPTAAGRRTCIVIVEVPVPTALDDAALQTLGLMVDAVSAVTEIPPTEIEPPPSFGARIRTDFIEGMARQQGRFVILLAIDQVLSMDELAGLAAVQEAAASAPLLPA